MEPLRKAIRAAGVLSCLLTAAVTVQGGIIDDNADDQDHQDLANQTEFDAVGVAKRLNTAGTSIIVDSSGILIGSEWVLTAAHTVIAKGLANDATFEIAGEVRDVVETYQHPSFSGIESGWDIALLKLDSPITSVTPAQLYTGTADSLVGEELVYVGYGRSGTGSTGDTIAAGTKRAGYNVGDQLGYTLNPGTSETVYSDHLIFADMDAKPGPFPWGNPLGSTNPLNLEILIALGDSGGGLFVEQGGQYYVAGVHSVLLNMDPVSTTGYGDVMGSTTIAAALDWIIDIMTPDPIDGDLNGDGFVGLDDIDIVLAYWNQTVTAGDLLSGDPSGDGFVGLDDLDIILNNWNSGTPPTTSQLVGIVPEPTTMLFLIAAVPGLLRRRR